MNRFRRLLLGLVLITTPGCRPDRAVEDLSEPPEVAPEDRAYRDVFRSLDGVWEGVFRVYVDERGQAATPVQPTHVDTSWLLGLPLRLQTIVRVRQVYRSESPYFQRVDITDVYRDPSGREHVVRSRGVNKVQDGRLWCVVEKPDERVVHLGERAGPNTLIWRRELRDPLKIEYFRETVLGDRYAIVGWGYYGDDDPGRSPRIWFLGDYRRAATGKPSTREKP